MDVRQRRQCREPEEPGVNKVMVQAARMRMARKIQRTFIDIWFDDGSTSAKSGASLPAPPGPAAGETIASLPATSPSAAIVTSHRAGNEHLLPAQPPHHCQRRCGSPAGKRQQSHPLRDPPEPDTGRVWFSATAAPANRISFADIALRGFQQRQDHRIHHRFARTSTTWNEVPTCWPVRASSTLPGT